MNRKNSISMIVAHGKRREIGQDNRLLWRLPEDMSFFKQKTLETALLVCGGNTLRSLPNMSLPGRELWVLSRDGESAHGEARFIDSDVLVESVTKHAGNIVVIGGEQIYRLFLPYATKLFVTRVDRAFPEADTYFPEYEKEFSLSQVLDAGSSKSGLGYEIGEYVRQ